MGRISAPTANTVRRFSTNTANTAKSDPLVKAVRVIIAFASCQWTLDSPKELQQKTATMTK